MDGVVRLGDRDYATWPYVLNLAHERGLKEIRTELLQAPTGDNDHTAIVKATVTFEVLNGEKDMGINRIVRVFEGLGDASPKNVPARIATALIRMAETRAKGRALRDATNIGMTLVEELADMEGEPARAQPAPQPARPAPQPQQPQQASQGPQQPKPAEGGGALVCQWAGCGKPLTKGQHDISTRVYGSPLCPTHQKEHAQQQQTT
jgi:hypothetical protein